MGFTYVVKLKNGSVVGWLVVTGSQSANWNGQAWASHTEHWFWQGVSPFPGEEWVVQPHGANPPSALTPAMAYRFPNEPFGYTAEIDVSGGTAFQILRSGSSVGWLMVVPVQGGGQQNKWYEILVNNQVPQWLNTAATNAPALVFKPATPPAGAFTLAYTLSFLTAYPTQPLPR